MHVRDTHNITNNNNVQCQHRIRLIQNIYSKLFTYTQK